MVVGWECGIGRSLPVSSPLASGTRARIPTRFSLCLGKKDFGRTLPETIENDLHRLHVGKLNRFQRFFHFLDADSVIANLPCRHQIVEHPEDFRTRIKCGRRTMQLHQVKPVSRKISQAVVDPRRKDFRGCSLQPSAAADAARLWSQQ